jgi:hypothetical protein
VIPGILGTNRFRRITELYTIIILLVHHSGSLPLPVAPASKGTPPHVIYHFHPLPHTPILSLTFIHNMPQPPLDIVKYLSKPLPNLREQYPPGTGGTGPRAEWDGTLKSVQVIDGFNEQVQACKCLFRKEGPLHTQINSLLTECSPLASGETWRLELTPQSSRHSPPNPSPRTPPINTPNSCKSQLPSLK